MPNARSSPTVVWWVYVMLCERNILYVGISPDPMRRFLHHQAGKSRFSRMRRPRELLACLPVGAHNVAAREERRLKGQTVTRKLEWVAMARQAPPWLHLIRRHGTSAFIAQSSGIATVDQRNHEAPSDAHAP